MYNTMRRALNCYLPSGRFHNGALGLPRRIDVLRAPVLLFLFWIILRVQDLQRRQQRREGRDTAK